MVAQQVPSLEDRPLEPFPQKPGRRQILSNCVSTSKSPFSSKAGIISTRTYRKSLTLGSDRVNASGDEGHSTAKYCGGTATSSSEIPPNSPIFDATKDCLRPQAPGNGVSPASVEREERIGRRCTGSGSARARANDRTNMLAAKRRSKPAGNKPVDNLHPLDVARGCHHLPKCSVEG